MSKEVTGANISRKRMKERRPDGPPQVPRQRRTPAQLAHLAELVEEKKPGSLRGSFGVFELAPPEPGKDKNLPQKQEHESSPLKRPHQPGLSTISHALLDGNQNGPRNAPEFVPPHRGDKTSPIPNLSRSNLQSFTNVQPFSDFRNNNITGRLTPHMPESVSPYHQAPGYHLNIPPSHNYEMTVSRDLPPQPLEQESIPLRPRATSYPPETSFKLEPEIEYADPILGDIARISPSDPTSQIKVQETWSFSSRSMLAGPKGAELAHLEDCLSEDIPIRAIIHGWDSIGERWELPPFWQIIRQLDENLFFLFGPVERLGVFRIVHLLMRFHSDPSPRRAATLPPFYNSKSIDFEGDYYIGNFLPWPGIREMTKNPLHPCRSNKWFQAELKTLKLLWPYQLQDTFTRSHDTGLFKLTDEFAQRTNDIHCWTFGPDMYEEFPMIYGTAPARGTIPGVPGLLGRRGGVMGSKKPVRRYIEYPKMAGEGGEEESQKLVRNGVKTMMEQNSPDYHNLHWKEEQREGKKVMYFTLW